MDLATQVKNALATGNGGTGLTASGANGNCLVSNGTNWTSGSCSGSSSTNFSAIIPDATNSHAGTFAVSGNTWDFSAAALFKLRIAAGCSTSTNGDLCYDTTNNKWLMWQGGANKNFIAASNLGTSGQPCLSNADGSCTFADPIVSGPDAVGVAPTRNPVQIGCLFLTSPATLTNNEVGALQCDSTQNLFVHVTNFPATQPVSGTVTANIGTTNGLALDASLSTIDTDLKASVAIAKWGGGTLGAMANYGTSPGAVLVPGVNAFVTNTVPVTGTFFQATQPVSVADGSDTTLGAKADAKSTATDTTAISIMQVLKEISAMEQAPASRAVTNAGTFAVQEATLDGAISSSILQSNTKQINGVTPLMGNGTSGTGSQRINIASDNSVLPAVGAGATGSAVPANAVYQAGNGSGNLTGKVVCDTFVIKNAFSTSGLTQIIAAPGAGKNTYICGFDVNGASSTLTNVKLVYGTKTTTDCDTGANDLSILVPVQASASVSPIGQNVTPGSNVLWKTGATNNQVCVSLSAAQAVNLQVWYTSF